jgi:hypothetical protein
LTLFLHTDFSGPCLYKKLHAGRQARLESVVYAWRLDRAFPHGFRISIP